MTGKVIVVGSINMDVVAYTNEHPSPGQTVEGHNLSFFPGGKGSNQAVAAARASGTVGLIGRVGTDEFGDRMLKFLSEESVSMLCSSRTDSEATGTALIVVNKAGENSIVVVPGANHTLRNDDIAEVSFGSNDVVLAQLEVPQEIIAQTFKVARGKGATTVLNPAPAADCSQTLLEETDVLVVNETEFEFFTAVAQKDLLERPTELIDRLRFHSMQTVILTLGANGVVYSAGKNVGQVEGKVVDVVDTTGAGDCFVGVLASLLTKGQSIEESVKIANCAAALSTTKHGAATSLPSLEEIERFRASIDDG